MNETYKKLASIENVLWMQWTFPSQRKPFLKMSYLLNEKSFMTKFHYQIVVINILHVPMFFTSLLPSLHHSLSFILFLYSSLCALMPRTSFRCCVSLFIAEYTNGFKHATMHAFKVALVASYRFVFLTSIPRFN